MNVDIKRHIDSARQVLVGVVPNPTSQIDQITNALIYKFMDDMDQLSIKNGGDPSFFIGDLEKYSWTRIMDSRIGNQERMNLFVEGFIKISESENIPQLFRNILKSAYLPYRSPEVLGLFLKEINFFDYSHPEDLGDAYEYLLSIMSSQGDAGQFRTPRHIIDFMVDAVNPTIEDKVLDPACGTAGFLISAYKHILEQHDGANDPEKKEKSLTPDQRKKLFNNFEGYDIDPGMVRIAQVNMYLHQFKNPKIFQYDSLSMEERWNDKFDVILANPPFMSPKGGIQPSKKFSIQSTRSEVLFVDYIVNHLKPKGKAGIIVPEGIIFQSGTAYKQLRKNLVDDGLYAVISLPSGVFNPYSGVKTSILLFDNEISKKSSDILFIKIENDGYDLGAQRREISKNDLPQALLEINAYKKYIESGNTVTTFTERIKKDKESTLDSVVTQHDKIILVDKQHIAKTGDYNLSGDRYRVLTDYSKNKWPIVKLGEKELFNIESGGTPDSQNASYWSGKINWATLVDLPQSNLITEIYETNRKITDDGLKKSSAKIIPSDSVLVSSRATIGRVAINKTELSTNQGFKNIVIKDKKRVDSKYLAYVITSLTDKLKSLASGGTFAEISKTNFETIEIPLPPLEIQKQLAKELDGYQNIIDGAKKVIENWKPKIDIDPEWKIIKLGDLFEMQNGRAFKKDEWSTEGLPIIRIENLNKINAEYNNFPGAYDKRIEINNDDLLFSWSGTVGTSFGPHYWTRGKGLLNQHIYKFNSKTNRITNKFAYYILIGSIPEIESKAHGAGGLVHITKEELSKIEIPVPALDIQKIIVEKIEAERKLVDNNIKLTSIYTEKIKEVISKLWENS